MLQYPSGPCCLVTEPGQGGSQVNLLLLPQDTPTQLLALTCLADLLGSTSSLLKRVGG